MAGPAGWAPLGSGGGASGTLKKLGTFGARGGSPLYVPPSGGGSDPSGATPGTYDVNVLDPVGTATQAAQESEGFLAGLKNALFGTSAPDLAGQHGGLLGDLPVIGAGTRAVSETVANVGGAVLTVGKGALDVTGGALEHIDLRDQNEKDALSRQFASIPDGTPEKQVALEKIAADPGATGHYMAAAVKAQRAALSYSGDIKPKFDEGLFQTPGSAADAVDNLFGFLGLTQRAGERTVAGMGKPGAEGMNRLEEIMAVGNGQYAYSEDKGVFGTGILAGQAGGGLNPIEAIVFQKYGDKEWSPDEALDFLASHAAGISHNQALQLAGSVAVDPQVLLSLGTGLLARGVATGARLAEAEARVAGEVALIERGLAEARAAGSVDDVARFTAQLAERQDALKSVQGAIRQVRATNKVNVLGKIAETKRGTDVVRALYKVYEPLQAMHVDRAAKVARTIIDPLSSFSLNVPGRKQVVDLMSTAGTRIVIGAYGDGNHLSVLNALSKIAPDQHLLTMFSEDLGTYSANVIRTAVGNYQRATALLNGLGDALAKTAVGEHIDDFARRAPRAFEENVMRAANANRIHSFDQIARDNLAQRLSSLYHTMTADEWADAIKALNDDQLGLLHAATYGRAQKLLLEAVELSKAEGRTGDLAGKMNRLILINRNTLTKQGAAGVLERIKVAKSLKGKAEVIREARDQYPSLRGFTVDEGDLPRSIDRFTDELTRNADAYPAQVIDTELDQLGTELQDLHRGGVFTLGFSPENEYKWGLQRVNEAAGLYAPRGDVWVDHVAPGLAMGYRPVWTRVATNVAGQPILGAATKLAKPIDIIDAGIHTMSQRISGTIIAESARKHFVAKAVERYGDAGITDEIAENIMRGLDEAVQRNDLVVRPSGLTSRSMWDAAEEFIPKSIRPSQFGKRELLNLVLEAYQGDMRHVGITQAFSSRVKRMLAGEGNNASVLAEQVYPFLKFRLNMIFQAQEKIEPYILNSARGITPARGRKLSEADKATAKLLDNLEQRSLVTNADHEMQEYSAKVMWGDEMSRVAASRTSVMGKMTDKLGQEWSALKEIKGVKRANMMRTFRAGLGREMRGVFDQYEPGLWDDMFLDAQARAGRLLDEDEFAVSLMAEKMLGNDVFVKATPGQVGGLADQFDKVDYKAAIVPGQWHTPVTLGEVGKLDLDSMAELLAFPVGRAGAVTRNQADLRAAIAAGDLSIEDVQTALRQLNADPDYISRVSNALSFSWTGFWGTLQRDFNLTKAQRVVLEDMIANAAALRGASPVDYISQIFSPTILNGTEGAVGALGRLVDIVDKDGNILGAKSTLAQIVALPDKGGTSDDLIRQLSSVFAAHLDPSAKRQLLMAFEPELRKAVQEGTVRLDLSELERMWAENGDDALGRTIIDAMNATEGDYFEANLPRTMAEYDSAFPAQGIELDIVNEVTGQPIMLTVDGIGPGFRNAPQQLRDSLITELARFKAQFPDIPLGAVDAANLREMFAGIDESVAGSIAVTIGAEQDIGSIIFEQAYMGNAAQMMWDTLVARSNAARQSATFVDPMGFDLPRISNFGADYLSARTPTATMRHELGHVIDVYLRRGTARTTGTVAARRAAAKRVKAYNEFVEEFYQSPAARMLSEYANESREEAMGELFAVALDPRADLAEFARMAPSPQVADDAIGSVPFGQSLEPDQLDEWLKRVEREYPEIDLATVEGALSRAGRSFQDTEDLWYAVGQIDKEIKTIEGIGPDDLDLFKMTGPQTVEEAVLGLRKTLQDLGIWKVVPQATADPDIIRAHQMFSKWTQAVVGANLKDASAPLSEVMSRVAGFPTTQAVPYNFTEHQLLTAATTAMREKWDDAHRLQYYARQRTQFERSLNHPMFGIYPASYMWGKMLPEMIRFVAKEPFGVKTGAMAYSLLDVQREMALQREFDPEFDKKIESLGHSAAMWTVNYMLPAVPWEVNANWPAWVRAFGQQGLDMQARAESGKPINTKTDIGGTGLNPTAALQKAADLINPLKPIERSVLGPIKELAPQPEAPSAPVTGEPIPATELGNPLSDALKQLQSLLGG